MFQGNGKMKMRKGEGITAVVNHTILILVAIFWLSLFMWLFFAAIDPKATSAFKVPDSTTLQNFVMVFRVHHHSGG